MHWCNNPRGDEAAHPCQTGIISCCFITTEHTQDRALLDMHWTLKSAPVSRCCQVIHASGHVKRAQHSTIKPQPSKGTLPSVRWRSEPCLRQP